ncbi:hypothetical protein JFL43_16615 [Viridibacillus sp. YIM B01967]|uniref:Uncharacterized protein n=1 Tax=Viridibacillus soli TaxID=2798301 RepID=A0ABS1HAM0_9BACL|nr:hypothetical protein [Viridibacillus soli]MBK3496451.1 hypothetical protein [Viridibacillus soli]
MPVVAINMMNAFTIEKLRDNAISNEQIIEGLEKQEMENWKEIDATLNFDDLVALYQNDRNALESALMDGYSVKFLTFNGLKNLLKMRLHKIEGEDFQICDTGLTHLSLSSGELAILQQMLSINWSIEGNTNDPTINVLLK